MRQDFYIYALLDPLRPGPFEYGQWSFPFEPFYIGKGRGRRLRVHLGDKRPSHKRNRIIAILAAGAEPIQFQIKGDMEEADAFFLEQKAIRIIGRRRLNEGPLTNYTKGGEGKAGDKQHTPSEETRRKISETLRGRKLPARVVERMKGRKPWNAGAKLGPATPEQRAHLAKYSHLGSFPKGHEPANKGVPMTPEKYAKCAGTMFKKGERQPEEIRAKIAAALTGRKASDEFRAKVSAAKKGRPNGLLGKKRDAQTCANISAGKKGRPNDKARGKKRPPHVIAAMQAGRARSRAEKKAST